MRCENVRYMQGGYPLNITGVPDDTDFAWGIDEEGGYPSKVEGGGQS